MPGGHVIGDQVKDQFEAGLAERDDDLRCADLTLRAEPDEAVHLGGLGQYLKRTDPAFSPQTYGHSGLLDMLRTYDLLTVQQETGGYWTVRLAPAHEAAAAAVFSDIVKTHGD